MGIQYMAFNTTLAIGPLSKYYSCKLGRDESCEEIKLASYITI